MCRAEHRVAADLMFSVIGGRVQPAVIFRDGRSAEDKPDSARVIIICGRRRRKPPVDF